MNSKNIMHINRFKFFLIIMLIILIANPLFACENEKMWKTVVDYENLNSNEVGLRVKSLSIDSDYLISGITGECTKDVHYYAIVFYNSKTDSENRITNKMSDLMYDKSTIKNIIKNKSYCILNYGSTALQSSCKNSKLFNDSDTVALFGVLSEPQSDDISFKISTDRIISQLSINDLSKYDRVALYITKYSTDNFSSKTGWIGNKATQTMSSDNSGYERVDDNVLKKIGLFFKTGLNFVRNGFENLVKETVHSHTSAPRIFLKITFLPLDGLITTGKVIVNTTTDTVDGFKEDVTLTLTKNNMFSGPNIEAGYKVASLNIKNEDSMINKCPDNFVESDYDPLWSALTKKIKYNGENKVLYYCVDDYTYRLCYKETGNIEEITFSELKNKTRALEIYISIAKAKLYGAPLNTAELLLNLKIDELEITKFKNDICKNRNDIGQQPPSINDVPSAPSDVGSDTTEEQVEPVAPQQVNLDFTVYSSIPDISYSTTTATQYKARKVNDQEAYLIDYRNNKKEISVNLSSLNYTRPVYAILATPDQSDKIYGYLANIKSTGEFKDYTLQTNFTVNSNTLATSPAAMKYTMGSDKTFKFSIAPNVNDKFVLIFMQLSDDGSLINLTYTNLYNLDYNAQSIYQLCEINRNIVNFYCKGYDCKVPGSCIDRWDFDPSKLDGVSGIPVDAIPVAPTSPKPPLETPPATPKPPLETPPATPTPPVSQDTTLAKGADGCYTTNPETLAKIRQEGGIGINKQQFAGKRTKSSIVFPGTSNGTDDDPSLTVDQIKNVFNRPSLNIPQKVKDASPAFYNLGLLYNVDPVYSLAFFRAEKSLYNQNSGSVTQTLISHNDISGVTRVCRCGGKKVVGSKYCSYPTLEQGIEAFYLNLDKGTTNSPNIYKNKSFAQVAKTWNGHDSYVTSITRYLADTYVWAGK